MKARNFLFSLFYSILAFLVVVIFPLVSATEPHRSVYEYGSHHYCVDSEGGSNMVIANVSGYIGLALSSTPSPSEIELLYDYCTNERGDDVAECSGSFCLANDMLCVPLSDGRWGYNIYSFRCTDKGATGCKKGACVNIETTTSTATCTDGQKNQDETDIDCGGSCSDCGSGKRCLTSADCQSSICDNGVCRAVTTTTAPTPTCSDGIQNRDETGVDCGGKYCNLCRIPPPTTNRGSCIFHCDRYAVSDNEYYHQCIAICDSAFANTSSTSSTTTPTCTDSDGGENYFVKGDAQGFNRNSNREVTWSDHCTDSGGRSLDEGPNLYETICRNNEVIYLYNIHCEYGCVQGACRRGSTASTNTASPPTPSCTDGVKNGAETDVDCGSSCHDCANGMRCLTSADCQSSYCAGGLCREVIARGATTESPEAATPVTPVEERSRVLNRIAAQQEEIGVSGEDTTFFTRVARRIRTFFGTKESTGTRAELPAGVSEGIGSGQRTLCDREGRTPISGVDLCNGLGGLRVVINALRNELLPRIEDLENEVNRIRDEEIERVSGRVSKAKIHEEVKALLGNCTSATNGNSEPNIDSRYGTCENYCESQEKVCSDAVGYYIDSRMYFPSYRSMGCGQSLSDHRWFLGYDCICCTFPS